VLSALDKWERDPAAAERQLQGKASVYQFVQTLGDAQGRPDATLMQSASAAPLAECLGYLRSMGLEEFVDVDLRIVRGLAYYTGIVFELFDAKRSLRAICGGGRYDDLIKAIAGVDLPCVGFGMGDVVLTELLKESQKLPEATTQLDAFLVAVGSEDVPAALGLAHELRDKGIAVEYALHHQPIRKQLELAAARGAPRALIIGPDERKAKVAIVRDLRAGRQKRVPLTKVRKGIFK
jgi:histidyl-tRNA synthetase